MYACVPCMYPPPSRPTIKEFTNYPTKEPTPQLPHTSPSRHRHPVPHPTPLHRRVPLPGPIPTPLPAPLPATATSPSRLPATLPAPSAPPLQPPRPSSMPGAAVKLVSTAVWAPPGFLQWHEVALQWPKCTQCTAQHQQQAQQCVQGTYCGGWRRCACLDAKTRLLAVGALTSQYHL
jgi:hypothetical protein